MASSSDTRNVTTLLYGILNEHALSFYIISMAAIMVREDIRLGKNSDRLSKGSIVTMLDQKWGSRLMCYGETMNKRLNLVAMLSVSEGWSLSRTMVMYTHLRKSLSTIDRFEICYATRSLLGAA